ncbi:hypothetical protein A3E39_03545 [Candidatus Uhrbacteria bacterium RIFCSPHIGHO2_12_FULL_60_25]|uniref:Uncharacterized protein n=1 Tax=Candidatus Uhrbacteria bacterium RIFCSPHIGHO2_12_FULL_60_25 TaxID=1802399 RepID=A0A1F7UMF4_9BACT|nr:MAG: hypothetical protein A3D73_03560 [Candidatus Uhrbacteria bacterium RIFCSPHIGHO2_02_FULL_60_44]OGL78877.1 MAG: hypothetical protein A3E39_03545 [Candidatus Uhrbacteria bacterium RIFCSPHIGHO2_12_FULL_60_25]
MTRTITFFLIRAVALLWVMALANIAKALNPWAISVLILVSEVALGIVWGRMESQLSACKPRSPNPNRLFVLMVFVGIVESVGSVILVSTFAPWLIVWRTLTAYIPFSLAEFFVYRKLCRVK